MTTTSIHNNTRIIGLAAVVLAILVSALGAWFHSAGTALAPDIVRVTGFTNSGVSPADYYVGSGTGYYVESRVQTPVVRWTSSASGAPAGVALPAIGTPCVTAGIPLGSVTNMVISKGLTMAQRRCT